MEARAHNARSGRLQALNSRLPKDEGITHLALEALRTGSNSAASTAEPDGGGLHQSQPGSSRLSSPTVDAYFAAKLRLFEKLLPAGGGGGAECRRARPGEHRRCAGPAACMSSASASKGQRSAPVEQTPRAAGQHCASSAPAATPDRTCRWWAISRPPMPWSRRACDGGGRRGGRAVRRAGSASKARRGGCSWWRRAGGRRVYRRLRPHARWLGDGAQALRPHVAGS